LREDNIKDNRRGKRAKESKNEARKRTS